MECSYDQIDNTLIFRIEEHKFDTPIATEVKEKLLSLLADGEIKNLLFNLSSVNSIDSSGLSSLLFGRRQVSDRDGECFLINPQPKVVSLLKIARLDTVFDSFADEGSALKSL